ncbi:uncharacterized protein BDZ99DRAFT_575698 [Mytilinidion resinicola]|uniref:Transcription factor domain-containing protein n=1 Tax=Mytilinidion resinicola TaxID=574789 RepID=A0A6A6Y5H1_9PEZI|nr:uncharacterized protein BDZ99DRAFT_575698 [Mytilinidion resinicola]KAF2804042.1 hypothetical protein BDZ99DRAFT_575698 [Mytilinidion resinicola]
MAILKPSRPEFAFVSQEFNDDGSKQSVDRKTVRKQAMRAVAVSRRARGNYGKHNLRQYPIMLLLDEEVNQAQNGDYELEATSQIQQAPCRNSYSIPSSPIAQGFESMRIRFGVDILELPSLASSHLARLASSRLASEPAIFAGLLQCKQVSYIGHVPARFGNSVCMEDAASCLAAKMRRMLCPNDAAITDVMVIGLYSKALKSLQNAINDPVQVLNPDTLCATELLAAFEFLEFSQHYQGTRQYHLDGAACIIRHRGPNSYKSDYEISLFMALSGPIFTDAMWQNDNRFIVEEGWQNAVYAMVDPHSSLEGSPMVVEFWARIVHVSAYFRDVTAIVCGQDILQGTKYSHAPTCTEGCEHPPKSVHELACRGFNIRRRIQEWRHEYRDMLIEDTSYQQSKEAYAVFRWQFFGVYLSVTALLNRLIGAISSSMRIELENESHEFASRVVLMEQDALEEQATDEFYLAQKTVPRADFYSTQKVVVARSILATSMSWSDDSMTDHQSPIGEEQLIERWKFEAWCKLLGRSNNSPRRNLCTLFTVCSHEELPEIFSQS